MKHQHFNKGCRYFDKLIKFVTWVEGSSVSLLSRMAMNRRRSNVKGACNESSTERTVQKDGKAAVTHAGMPARQQGAFYCRHLTDHAQAEVRRSWYSATVYCRWRRIVTVSWHVQILYTHPV